jgi:pyruvate dehydrogenase kinase 2/3/4
MALEPVARAVAEEVARWGAMRQTGVSLRYMMEFGVRPTERTLLLAAQFLHKELPIRIARRALDLDSLPFGLSTKPAILKVVFVSCLLPLPHLSLWIRCLSGWLA